MARTPMPARPLCLAGVLEFNTIGNVGSGPSSLGAPTTIANATIGLTGNLRLSQHFAKHGSPPQCNRKRQTRDHGNGFHYLCQWCDLGCEYVEPWEAIATAFSAELVLSAEQEASRCRASQVSAIGPSINLWATPIRGATTVNSGQLTARFFQYGDSHQSGHRGSHHGGGVLNVQGKTGQAVAEILRVQRSRYHGIADQRRYRWLRQQCDAELGINDNPEWRFYGELNIGSGSSVVLEGAGAPTTFNTKWHHELRHG